MRGAEARPKLTRRIAGPVERLAERLHPHRATLLTAGFAAFALGLVPFTVALHGLVAPARWQVTFFATSVPIVLWAIGLVVLVTFFHPTEGLVGTRNRDRIAHQPWLQTCLRAYASLTVGAFGVSPVVVLGAAAI
jgi:hypothetical protein